MKARSLAATSSFRPRDAALLGILALIWGNSFLFIKIAVARVAPLWVVTIRMTTGGLLLAALAIALGQPLRRDARLLATLGFVGLTGAALPWAGQAWAQQYLDSGLVSVLNSCTPVMTLIFAVVSRQERLYGSRVAGLAVAIAGTLIVLGGEVGSGRSVAALAVAVLATAGYAVSAVVARARISGRVPALPAAATQLCLAAGVFLPFAFAAPAPGTSLPASVVGALLALGVLGTGLAFFLYFVLLESVGATNASMVTYLAPVVGLTSGALFRHERFGANVFLGAATLVFGVWLSQRRPAALA